jgi:hypothetical protein
MSLGKDTINGKGLAAKWGVYDIHELSYRILKYDLSVLDPPRIPILKFFFNPKNFRIDSDKILEIIQNNPHKLYHKLFLADEIDKVGREINFATFTKTKLESSAADPKPEGKYCRSTPQAPFPQVKKGDSSKQQKTNDIVSVRKCLEPAFTVDKVFSGKRKKTNVLPEKALKDVIEDHEDNIRKYSNVFSLIGKVWFVKFKKQEWGLYPNQQKYKYIAYLLSLPNNSHAEEDPEFSIPNADLVARVRGKEITEDHHAGNELDGLNDSDLADNLSPMDIKKFKEVGYKLLEKLDKRKKSGNLELINATQKEIDKYQSYLLNEYGIKTKISMVMHKINYKTLYRPGKENEKIRQLVKNNTNNAIKDFQDHMPMLGKHLKNSLKTKVYTTIYSPQTHINWHVSM